jgi:hypothetical protein
MQTPKGLVALIAACLLAAACGANPASAPSVSPSASPLQPSVSPSPQEPAGLAESSAIPAGWTLQRSFQLEPGPPVVWVRVYAKAAIPDSDPLEGPGRLVAYQAFGSSQEWTGTRTDKARLIGAEQFPVTVNGETAAVWHVPSTGELLLAWSLGGNSLALVANITDFSAAGILEVAQGFAIAP